MALRAQLLGLLFGQAEDLLDARAEPGERGRLFRGHRALDVDLLEASFEVGDSLPRGLQLVRQAGDLAIYLLGLVAPPDDLELLAGGFGGVRHQIQSCRVKRAKHYLGTSG